MTLDELIAALEAADPALRLPLGFSHPHSYRGDYMDLAFEPTANVTIGEMLADARAALGTTYQGWKGGDFLMEGWTSCWLAEEGTGGGETIGPILLTMLLASGQLDDTTCEKLASLESGWTTQRRAKEQPTRDAVQPVRERTEQLRKHLDEQNNKLITALQAEACEQRTRAEQAEQKLAELRPEYGIRAVYISTRMREEAVSDNADDAREQAAKIAESSNVVSAVPIRRPVGEWEEFGGDRG